MNKPRSNRMATKTTHQRKLDTSAIYVALLADIKERVQQTAQRAAVAANAELVALYWDIGHLIVTRQVAEGWGTKVVDRLAADLRRAFPNRQGFSPRNLKYMRAFALAWPAIDSSAAELSRLSSTKSGALAVTPIVQAPLAQLQKARPPIVQAVLAQLPWYHHIALLDKLNNSQDRIWYANQAVANGWSRNLLAMQIDSRLHLRSGRAVTNFARTLPPGQSDLAQSIIKDPYLFDFLGLTESINERALEAGLIAHVEKFLLELGIGFALIGRQQHLEIGDQDFYLDLLFYHWKLRCFVVIDLKTREFTPEAAGKMNFYLSAVDDRFRQASDQPTIGLILCREKNRFVAEYALRDINKPIGVSGFVTKLVDSLPKNLRGAVPTIREIEAGLAALTASDAVGRATRLRPRTVPHGAKRTARGVARPKAQAKKPLSKAKKASKATKTMKGNK